MEPAFVDNRPRWRYPAGVDEKGEVEVEVEVADSEVEVVTAVEEEEAVSVTEATRAAMHAEREVTLPGTVIRAEDPVMGLGAGTLDPDADQTTEAVPGRVLVLDHHHRENNVSTVAARVAAHLRTRSFQWNCFKVITYG